MEIVIDEELVEEIPDDTRREYITAEEARNQKKQRKPRGPNRNPKVPAILNCELCEYTTVKKHLLAQHLIYHSEDRPYKCSLCGYGFKTLGALKSHIDTHTGNKTRLCPYCERPFTTTREMKRHVAYIHTQDKRYKCNLCEYASVENSKLKRHMLTHMTDVERPYKCPTCSYAAIDSFALTRHIRVHTGEKPYECDICHSRFSQGSSLKSHKLIHSGERPIYHCEMCPSTRTSKKDLRRHFNRLHTTLDEPIACKHCDEKFYERYAHNEHIRSQDCLKKFECEVCQFRASTEKRVKQHMLVHSNPEKITNICSECGDGFANEKSFMVHKESCGNKKRFQCPTCQKYFNHKGHLKRHEEVHTKSVKLEKREGEEGFLVKSESGAEEDENEFIEQDQEEMDESKNAAEWIEEGNPEEILVEEWLEQDNQDIIQSEAEEPAEEAEDMIDQDSVEYEEYYMVEEGVNDGENVLIDSETD